MLDVEMGRLINLYGRAGYQKLLSLEGAETTY
jgi:hypothetical protein